MNKTSDTETSPESPTGRRSELNDWLGCPCCGSTDIGSDKVLYMVHKNAGLVNCRNCGLNMLTSTGQEAANKRWNTRSAT